MGYSLLTLLDAPHCILHYTIYLQHNIDIYIYCFLNISIRQSVYTSIYIYTFISFPEGSPSDQWLNTCGGEKDYESGLHFPPPLVRVTFIFCRKYIPINQYFYNKFLIKFQLELDFALPIIYFSYITIENGIFQNFSTR